MSGARPGAIPNSPSNSGTAINRAVVSIAVSSGVTTTQCRDSPAGVS